MFFMEKDLVTNLQPIHNGTVVFIEPNNFNDYNLTSGNEEADLPVNLDDLCIYCNLVVENVSRMNDSTDFFFEAVITSDGRGNQKCLLIEHSSQTSIMQGTKLNEDDKYSVLTTSFTDSYFKDNEPNYECIGINSINVNYDAWLCPTIDIEFVDVRGLSIFSINEQKHDGVDSRGMSGFGDITDAFFSCFFKFPYPNFKLYLKGFYGEPVGYDIALNNATHTFDSKSGNFIIKANFIGYKFGILNDLTMTSLASAVSSTEGYDYWKKNVDDGVFVDMTDKGEKPLIPLVKIAEQYHIYKVELNKAVDNINNNLNEEEEKVNFYIPLSAALETYKMELKAFAEEVTNETITFYKKILEGTFNKSDNLNNPALWYCFGGEATYKKYREKAKNDLIGELDKEIVANFMDENEGIYHFCIPDNSLFYVAEHCNLFAPLSIALSYKPSANPINCFEGSTWRNSVKNVHKNLVWDDNSSSDLETYVSCTNGRKTQYTEGKHYIGVLSSNTLSFMGEQMTTCGDSEDGYLQITDFKGQKFKTNILDKRARGVDKISNRESFQKLVDAYDKCVSTIKDIEENKDYLDTDLKKSIIKEFKEIFTKVPTNSGLHAHMKIFDPRQIVPCDVIQGCFVPKRIEKKYLESIQNRGVYSNKTFGSNNDYYACNVFARLLLSEYRLDFRRLNDLLKQLESLGVNFEEKAKKETEAVTEALKQQYLTFEPSIRYLTKCLWGHVETLLHLCYVHKYNIISNKETRTVGNLGLTRENSHLPNIYYESDKLVPPFPKVYKREKISETQQERLVDDYLGNVATDAEEVKLVDELLYGASHYYDVVHFDVDETSNKENIYVNSTDDIRIGVYDYLGKLFDKWMYTIKSDDDLRQKWGVKEYFDDHFLFIDTFYNKIGYDLCLDTANFGQLCENIFNQKGQSLMSFICNYMQNENCILQPTQNFMLNLIENQDDTINYYNRIFTPVPLSQMKDPKSVPYFVMIYRGKPSEVLDNYYDIENENDGFMVYTKFDDNVYEIPVGLLEKKIVENDILQGYPIPAIGITYGKQNQNYFIDIKVDTSKPMANEVALAAQYEIAGLNISNEKGNNGSSERILSFGQDLYTVYANNSYTCTITMLGCMWIQPLMYFQLNNVPMFRGTYMIQKVSHSMTVGNMTTTFTGVRMSRFSSPFVKKQTYGLSGERQAEWQRRKERKASYDNNCPYHWFDPNESDECIATESFTQAWLDAPFGTNYPTMGRKNDLSIWYAAVKNKPTKLALASIILQEDSIDDLAIYLHATVLFNSLLAYRKDTAWKKKKGVLNDTSTDLIWSGARWNAIKNTDGNLQKVLAYIKNPNTEKGKKLIQGVEKIFKESPAVLINKTTTDGHRITKEDLSALWFTTGQGQKYTSVATKNNLMFKHHDSKYYYMHPTNGKVNLWDVKPKNAENDKTFGDKLLDCIIQTFNFYEGQEAMINNSVENMEVVFDDVLSKNHFPSRKTYTFVVKDEETKLWVSARLTDILLNCYHKNIKSITCEWDKDVTITDETDPSSIMCEYSQEEQPITKISFKQNGKLFVIKEGQFPKDMLMVLKKKYQDLNSKKASSYILNEFEKG